MSESDAAGGLVSRAAARILQKADRERSGVISTAQSHTHFLDSPRMTRVMRQSTLELSVLKREPTSLYLVLPTDRLEAYARWLRIMVACALLAIARDRGQPKDRVLILLDEFAHLGKMHPVLRDIGLAGGFGVAFWLIVQDLSQLKSTYGEAWPTFLANADVLQAFGTNDWETAEHLSKLTGESTIHVTSENQSRGVSQGKQSHQQQGIALTTAEKGRRLLLADEVRRLDRETELLFVKAHAPILAERGSYLRDQPFKTRGDPNPLYATLSSPLQYR
jgi:type IV secretion system protein VirD4